MNPFDFEQVMLAPWTGSFRETFWVVLMGFLVTGACGLVGNYLLLRRMALVGDAISHSILPGLVVAFLLARSTSIWIMFAGALGAGMVTVLIIEFIHKQSRIKPDAAICIAFTTLFSIGVIMLSALESKGTFHLDPDCVLYGEIAFVGQEPPVVWNGISLAPPSVLLMGGLFAVVLLLILFFYKELLITSFDAGLAKSLGMNTTLWHYGIMAALSLVVVGAFQSVGAILAVAMIIVPPMFAAQLSDHLPTRLSLTLVHAALSSLIGWHLSVWLECSAASAMVVAGALLFTLAWLGTALAKSLPHPKGTHGSEIPETN